MLNSSLPPEDPRIIQIARDSFDLVDTDRSGTIDRGELRRALTKFAADFGTSPPFPNEVENTFDFLDKDHSGKIDFREYLQYIKAAYFGTLGQQGGPYWAQA